MRLVSIDNVKEKMCLGRSIYSADGNVLLAEGVNLNNYYIQRLKELEISSVYIVDQRVGTVEVDELVKIQTKNEAVKITKEVMNNIRNERSISGEKIHHVVKTVMEDLISHRFVAYNLVDIRAMNDYHFAHSVTVGVLSIMTGILAGYNYQRLKDLGIGALLHDIGKAMIPDKILNKAGKLTDEEYAEIKKHPQIGYDVLKKYPDIASVSAHAVWQHHERNDGSGYPRGIKGSEIHEFGRIIALADVYDALSTDRCYRKRLFPHEVIEYIRDQSKSIFDPELAILFLQNIAPFPIGSLVKLNNGETGVVIKVSKDLPARPVVRIIFNREGSLLPEPVDRDLKKDLTAEIMEVLRNEAI